MTIQQCKYTVEIANCGTFNEAATRLFLAQSSLSSSIKELETELGITIFERSKSGIRITVEGAEFLEYAKQIVVQADFIDQRYHKKKQSTNRFSVSSQHYDFATEAFSRLFKEDKVEEYNFRFRETKTYEVIEDVKSFDSEIGILFTNDFNEKVMYQNLEKNHLEFHPLFEAQPHIFVGKNHPLSKKNVVTIEELKKYPYITFEQNEKSSVQYAEEVYHFIECTKQIKVNDRATLLNLLVEMDGYTIGTGVIVSTVEKKELTTIPIQVNQVYTIGWIAYKDAKLSSHAKRYIHILTNIIKG